MMIKPFYFLLNSLLILLYRRESLLFNKSFSYVSETQEKVLFKILKANKNSEFGKKYNFFSIKTIKDFQLKVPLLTYNSYLPYIESILEGKKNILTSEPVLIFALSSGSTAPTKYIPYTCRLKKEFRRAIAPWICDLYLKKNRLFFGSSYWSISPVTSKNKISRGGIPIGFEDDREYFGLFEKLLLKHLLVIPKEVCEIKDIENFRYVTLLFLLKAKDLRFISVWSPTFLTILLKSLLEWLPLLINDIEKGTISLPSSINPEVKNKLLKRFSRHIRRAKEIRNIFLQYQKREFRGLICEKIWPNLVMISCWTDGNSALYLKELKSYLPNVEVQSKGLLSTEGVVSFPLVNEVGCILSIRSHFFEFIEVDNVPERNNLKLAHQLEKGKRYSVVITTSGGLYRYKLQDVIEVTGFKRQCPLVRFISKEDKISDLFGEKLNEYHIAEILNKLLKKYSFSPSFSLLAPERDNGRYSYVLFLSLDEDEKRRIGIGRLIKFRDQLEEGLAENYHYKYCRELGQLLKVRIFLVKDNAVDIYNNVYRSRGYREGDIKISVIDSKDGWVEKFRGTFLNERETIGHIA
ncbi:MAG: GH3 auxin-responsive promoter family protein [Candidatus Omnitrophota bacterium]